MNEEIEQIKPSIRPCMTCGWLFVSPDRKRIARCQDCKNGEDNYSPRVANTRKVAMAVREYGDTS